MYWLRGINTYGCLGVILVFALMVSSGNALNCYQCNSNDDPNCLDNSKLEEAKTCEGDGVTKCFVSNDGGVITRGCLKADQDCTGGNCISCDTDNCNNHNICKKCTTDDADCSQTDVSDKKYNDICPAADTQCFVNVKDKKVERRCAAADDSCSSDTICKKTTGSLSNAGLFPSKRIHCYQCAVNGCSDVTANSVASKPCRNYIDNDVCYMTAESATSVTRGCKSDDTSKCSSGSEQGCVTCSTDNCNNALYERGQGL
ncbi:uncharacterized protein LOC133333026 [Musca vetustissima]|uniref:uncharacterized protein LOC133333026 n=1 Tax=Musca vetustissima TaxID=27455 RepID=UPI002AB7975B|nr:uncharacterized protein LOC133333026 [Musca vetustissima]